MPNKRHIQMLVENLFFSPKPVGFDTNVISQLLDMGQTFIVNNGEYKIE